MTAESDYFNQLILELNTAEPAKAMELLESAAEAHPQDHRPVFLMAAGFAQNQDMDRAEAAYIETLRRAPDFATARFQMGLLQFTSGRPAAALSTWAPLDQLGDQHFLWMFKQGFVFLAQDQFDAAIHWLKEGIAHNAENPPLNRDMNMMIERIIQSGLSSIPAQPAGEGASEAPPSGNAPESHFLLSGYRKIQ